MILRIAQVTAFMLGQMGVLFHYRLFRPRRVQERVAKSYRDWAHHVLRVFEADLTVKGREHVPPGDGAALVVMSNHQSQLDIPALVAGLGRSAGFVAKRELTRIPVLNFWMRRLGCVFIDRGDRRKAHLALERTAKEMRGRTVVIFPEGTRSRTGELLPFKAGGARLAVLSGAHILPVTLSGTRAACEGRGGRRGKVPVTVEFHPVLETTGLQDDKAGYQAVREYVEGCWKRTYPGG